MKEELTRGTRKDFEQESSQWLDLERIIDWIGDNLDPQQVFNEGILESWAADNGWTKEN